MLFTFRNLLFRLIQIVLVVVRAPGVAPMVPEGGEKGKQRIKQKDKAKRKQSKKLINNRQNLIKQNVVLESHCQ